jgi:hypothetical protein
MKRAFAEIETEIEQTRKRLRELTKERRKAIRAEPIDNEMITVLPRGLMTRYKTMPSTDRQEFRAIALALAPVGLLDANPSISGKSWRWQTSADYFVYITPYPGGCETVLEKDKEQESWMGGNPIATITKPSLSVLLEDPVMQVWITGIKSFHERFGHM